MSKLSHESTADPPKKDDKDVKSLAHDIERVCVSSEATGNETVKNKESSKNDMQESEHSEEAQSPTGRTDSKEKIVETPQNSAKKGKLLATARKLDFESESPLEKARAKIKKYFEEEESSQYSDDIIDKYFKDERGPEWKFLLAKMLEERKSKGKEELTLEHLNGPGIYYLKLHMDKDEELPDFPNLPNTKIPCHYVGLSTNVYRRMGEHIYKDKDKIDQQLKSLPPINNRRYNWTLCVVMLKEIPVDEIKELQAVKGDEGEVLKVLEKIGIMEMKSLYPNGYNMELKMPTSMTYVDYEFTLKRSSN